MAEWSIAPVLKTGDSLRGPRVRISLPPRIQNRAPLGAFFVRGGKQATALLAGEIRKAERC
jgi:hypothetical protein